MDTQPYKLKITEKGKRALTKVAEWLEAGAPHKGAIDGFSMLAGIEEDERDWTGNYCGTVCCIAGAIAVFQPNGLRGDTYWGNVMNSALNRMGWGDVYDGDLGARGAIDRLFYGGGDENNIIQRSPAEAARTIRHLIATGEVEWDLPA